MPVRSIHVLNLFFSGGVFLPIYWFSFALDLYVCCNAWFTCYLGGGGWEGPLEINQMYCRGLNDLSVCVQCFGFPPTFISIHSYVHFVQLWCFFPPHRSWSWSCSTFVWFSILHYCTHCVDITADWMFLPWTKQTRALLPSWTHFTLLHSGLLARAQDCTLLCQMTLPHHDMADVTQAMLTWLLSHQREDYHNKRMNCFNTSLTWNISCWKAHIYWKAQTDCTRHLQK